jgi:protein-S-isoprenylcysteine O-methyltransferase Ste14
MKSKIEPPTYFLIFLILSIGLHFIFPIKKIIYPPYTYFGFMLILFGVILNLWTDFLFKKGKTTVKPYENPRELLIEGPFRISRHPMYLGMTGVLLGVAVLHGTLITFLFPLSFIILAELIYIPFEEKNLEQMFGEQYLDYKKKVRRWI